MDAECQKLMAVLEKDSLEYFTVFLKDLNKIYSYYLNKETALTLAIRYKANTITKYLLEQDVDVCKAGEGGITPLAAAVKVENLEIVKHLMEKGAELTVHSALPAAIESGNVDIFKCLLKHGARLDMIALDLVETIRRKHYHLLKYLLEIGANINNVGAGGYTPLTKAVDLEDLQLIKYFVEIMNADVNLIDQNGKSALSLAASQSKFRVAKYLIEKGADINEAAVALEYYTRWNVDFALYLESAKQRRF